MSGDVDIHSSSYVRELFDRVSSTYGYTNYIASFGFTERWRRQCIDALGVLADGVAGLDLMCGRGETWAQLVRKHPKIGRLTGLDISSAMIAGAAEQARRIAPHRIALLEEDVFASSIAPASADFILSTFGVKTFDDSQLRRLSSEIARILKPGGRFSLIEVSEPKGWFLRPLYMFYLRGCMPVIERLFLGYSYGFAMIGVYVASFGDCGRLQRHLEERGLRCEATKHFYGCASGLVGFKPAGGIAEGGGALPASSTGV
ncbi:MAG TPA: class I SAM-dependent methyltransferase [Gammaproteobacteria bacterium]|nr:class I SAM-dependent methyltransferase [Gammaproteobacteria bacterium]